MKYLNTHKIFESQQNNWELPSDAVRDIKKTLDTFKVEYTYHPFNDIDNKKSQSITIKQINELNELNEFVKTYTSDFIVFLGETVFS